jgi:Flp pilus assembly protein TadB
VSALNLYTTCSFFLVILGGAMLLVVLDIRKQRSHVRIATRMQALFPRDAREKASHAIDPSLARLDGDVNVLTRWLRPKLARLRTVAGNKGLHIVVGATLCGAALGALLAVSTPLPAVARPLAMLGVPLYVCYFMYHWLIRRFRLRFLNAFPEAIDLIVRAVRAGVPLTQGLAAVADDSPEPLKTEFRIMADSLKVGRELQEVLAVAVRRIRIADFSFFCVCLLLQRETGGQLGETLDNLAGIIRTRREIRLKSKALTAEARITTKILGAIPGVIVVMMYLLNRTYVEILFGTESGHKLLSFAVISLVFGITLINRLSKLDTSR